MLAAAAVPLLGDQVHVLDHHHRGLQRPCDRAGRGDAISAAPVSTTAPRPANAAATPCHDTYKTSSATPLDRRFKPNIGGGQKTAAPTAARISAIILVAGGAVGTAVSFVAPGGEGQPGGRERARSGELATDEPAGLAAAQAGGLADALEAVCSKSWTVPT